MTREEALKLLTLASVEHKKIIPVGVDDDDTMSKVRELADYWAVMLNDIPFGIAWAAMTRHLQESPFEPRIGNIRMIAKSMAENQMIPAEKAWLEVMGRIKQPQYGYYLTESGDGLKKQPEEPMWSNPIIGEIVKGMGGLSALRASQKGNDDRYNFLKSYERYEKRESERLANEGVLNCLPANMRESVKALTERGELG